MAGPHGPDQGAVRDYRAVLGRENRRAGVHLWADSAARNDAAAGAAAIIPPMALTRSAPPAGCPPRRRAPPTAPPKTRSPAGTALPIQPCPVRRLTLRPSPLAASRPATAHQPQSASTRPTA